MTIKLRLSDSLISTMCLLAGACGGRTSDIPTIVDGNGAIVDAGVSPHPSSGGHDTPGAAKPSPPNPSLDAGTTAAGGDAQSSMPPQAMVDANAPVESGGGPSHSRAVANVEAIDFGEVASRADAATIVRSFSIINAGPGVITPVVALTEAAALEFHTSGCTNGPLLEGSRCDVTVTTTPRGHGDRDAFVVIRVPSDPDVQIPVHVHSRTGPQLIIEGTTDIDFGDISFAGWAPTVKRVLTLRNVGSEDTDALGILWADGNQGFSDEGTCGASLGAGATCTVTVLFNANRLGEFRDEGPLGDRYVEFAHVMVRARAVPATP